MSGGEVEGVLITGGYGSPAGPDTRFITWAQETAFTGGFWTHQVEEAWIVVWPEHLGAESFLAGVNLGTLAADYTLLTGKQAPFVQHQAPHPPRRRIRLRHRRQRRLPRLPRRKVSWSRSSRS